MPELIKHGKIKQEVLLRIYLGESDIHEGRPLYRALVRMFREEKLAGATVIRGILGYFADNVIQTAHILRLSQDLPVIIEVVDSKENIDRVLPKIDEMMQEGLITMENVKAIKYIKKVD